MIQKYALVCFAFFAFIASGFGQTTYTENFDIAANWGGGAAGSYNAKTYFRSGQPVTFAATSAIRQGIATQDGFATTRSGSTYSWRHENATGNWTATIASGGVGTFSIFVRRWDGTPDPNYVCEYSLDNGATYSNVQLINNVFLVDSNWKQVNGTINTSNTTGASDDIIIRIRYVSGERIMIDDFEMTDFAGSTTYNVTYNGNGNTGGTVPTDATAYDSGDNVTVLDAGTLTRTGFNFVEWNTAADGTGDSYVLNDTFTITANTELFAMWAAITDTVDYCNLQNPQNGTVEAGELFNIQARVYEAGLTDTTAGQSPGIDAWIGYSSTNATNVGDFTSIDWTWVPATFLTETNGNNNDEYQVNLGEEILTPGTYYYVSRFSLNSGPFSYGGFNVGGGGFWNGTSNVSGVLTVTPAVLDFYNLQFPQNGTIDLGDSFDVYAEAYEAGVTEAAGVGNDIVAWIGYSTTNATTLADFALPSWTWVSAPYVGQAGPFPQNNDNFMLDLGTEINAAGTYYYVSRFQYNSGDFLYGGFNTGAWDGVANVSGVLTIIGEPDILITGYQNNFVDLLTNDINNGDETPAGLEGSFFPQTNINATSTKKYRITNTGSETLNVTSIAVDAIDVISTNGATPPGAIVYTDTTLPSDHFYLSDEFGVAVTSTALNITAGNFADFYVTFSPQAMGWQFAKVKINNNVVGKNPYTYLITGNGLTPDINITGNGNAVINGSTVIDVTTTNNTFIGNANAAASESVSQPFIITNTGNTDLILGAITVSGADASMFTATVDLTTITTSGLATLTVTFTPTSQGVKNAVISIANNDALGGENPYTFAVQGNAQNFIACAPAEEIIYQTGFEEVEFTTQTNYQESVFDGPIGQQWFTYYGTPSTTAPIISGTKSLQMRLYTNGNIGYTQTEFDLENVTKVEFRAKSPNAELDIQVSFSTDGGATFNNNPQIYDVSATGDYNNPPVFTYVVSPTGAFDNVRIRFTISGTPPSSGRKDISIDDIIIYAGSNNVKTWDEFNWRDVNNTITTAPTSSQKAIFAGDYDTSSDGGSVEACECEVNSGAVLNITNGNYVRVQNNIIVDGEINVSPQGSLVQVNDLGTITLNNSSAINRLSKFTHPLEFWYDYTYWSSPLEDAQIETALFQASASRRFLFNASNFNDIQAEDGNTGNFNPGEDDIDDEGDDWFNQQTGSMIPGVGYAATHNSSFFTQGTQYQYIFEGTQADGGAFNNGNIDVDIYINPIATYNDWNFIGNPYPSAINAGIFFQHNFSILEGVIYLWSQSEDADENASGNQNQNFSQDDYAMINYIGGIATSGDSSPNGSNIPNGFVPSGQGFFVIGKKSGASSGAGYYNETVFTNAMRDPGNNNQFFRTAEDVQPNKLWVNLTSDNGVFNQVLLGYVDGATDTYDGMHFDAPRNLSTNASSILYSIIPDSDKKFAIQGKKPSSLTLDEVIPLGFYTSINQATIYKLSIAQFEGEFFTNQTVYVKDNLLNLYHDLSAADYSFTSETGEFNERFEIVFQTQTLGIGGVDLQPNDVSIIELNNGNVKFTVGHNLTIQSVEIYDMLGRQLYNLSGSNGTEIYNLSNLNQAAYVAKVTLSNGQSVTKRAVKRQ